MTSEKTIIALIVSLALFMDALDATIINTAIPAMSASLQVEPVEIKVALISYLLTLAIFIPISPWLGDRFGVKRVFMMALGVFTVSSLWCGYVSTLSELAIARCVQGFGGALMLPVGRLILLRTFRRHEFIEAMNAVVIVISIGLMLGPLAGGIITTHFSWHWIFWVNVPIGILALASTGRYLRDKVPQKMYRLDYVGFILFGGGLAGLIFALNELSEEVWSAKMIALILGVSCLVLITYFWYSKDRRHPIINMKLFRFRTFRVSIVGNIFSRLGFGGIPFLLPLLLQVGLGYSPETAGFLLVPIALGIIAVKPISLRILRLTGYKRLLLLNTFLVSFSLWSFRFVGAGTPLYLIAIHTFIYGLLMSLQYSSINSLAFADIADDEESAATSIAATVQQFSQSLGVVTAALLLRFYTPETTIQIALTPTVFHQVFFAMGFLTFLSIFIFLALQKHDGHQMLSAPQQEKAGMH